jgi:sensor histidine kinase YesM
LSLLNSPKTSESIARLSEILDYILYRCNVPKVPLAGEIKLIENYVALEKLRYDERLRVRFDKIIEKEVEIAPLLLLTLVENAFKHGASEDAGSPTIDIELCVNEQHIRFNISNSVKMSEETSRKTGSGIGLKNLRQQLDLIYGKNYGLETYSDVAKFEVELLINPEPNKS